MTSNFFAVHGMADTKTIECFTVGPIGTNCYLLLDEETKEAFLVDPGDEAEYLISELNRREVRLRAVLLTHGHFDHVLAVSAVKEAYPGAEVLMGERERPMAENEDLNSGFPGQHCSYAVDRYLAGGEEISLAGVTLRVLETPGHTAGSVCYYAEELGVLFAGDTLFYHSYGRYDLPTGSVRDLRESLTTLLTTLPEEVQVLPGHGRTTTIKEERIIEGFAR